MMQRKIVSLTLAVAIWSQLSRSSLARKDKATTEFDFFTPLYAQAEGFPFDLDAALKQCKIVPDIIDESPEHTVDVLYEDESVPDLGVYLRPEDMVFQPKSVVWPDPDGDYYTLIIADPDNPTRMDYTEEQFLHWLVVNARNGTWNETGEVIAPYIGPDPALDSGLHRILHLVYKQPDKIEFEEPHLTEDYNDTGRKGFIVRNFAKKYELGEVYAINFFFVENWDIVDTDETPSFMGLDPVQNPLDALDELELADYLESQKNDSDH